MPSKYDTNPLDPDFPEKARAAAAAHTESLPPNNAETRPFAPPFADEVNTRRFSGVYSPPASNNTDYFPQTQYGAPNTSICRKVEKLGLPENIATAIPYIPWYFGMVAAILMLLFVPKSETKVRFHAAQGLSAHVGILIVTSILGIVSNVTGVAEAANVIFQIFATVMLVIFVVKAWRGKPVHIESIDDLTNWFEEKLSPKILGH